VPNRPTAQRMWITSQPSRLRRPERARNVRLPSTTRQRRCALVQRTPSSTQHETGSNGRTQIIAIPRGTSVVGVPATQPSLKERSPPNDANPSGPATQDHRGLNQQRAKPYPNIRLERSLRRIGLPPAADPDEQACGHPKAITGAYVNDGLYIGNRMRGGDGTSWRSLNRTRIGTDRLRFARTPTRTSSLPFTTRLSAAITVTAGGSAC